MNEPIDDFDGGLKLHAGNLRREGHAGAAGFILRARDRIKELESERDLLAEALNAHKNDAIRVMQLEKLNRDMVSGLNNALAILNKWEAMK